MNIAPELLEKYHPKIAKVSAKDASLVIERSGGICENCKSRRAEAIHHLCGRQVKAGHGFPLYDETDFMALIKKYRLREEK